jgi:hypothetical protein
MNRLLQTLLGICCACGCAVSGCRSAGEGIPLVELRCRVDEVTYQSLHLTGGKILPLRSAKLTVISGWPSEPSLDVDLFQELSAADEPFTKGNIVRFAISKAKLEHHEKLSQGDLRGIAIVGR